MTEVVLKTDAYLSTDITDISVQCVNSSDAIVVSSTPDVTVVNEVKTIDIYNVTNEIHVELGSCNCSGASGESIGVESFTLTNADITNMFVTLTQTPTEAEKIDFQVAHAPIQICGIDFRQDTLFLKRITWEGLGLDGVLETGDKIKITYPK